MGGYTLVLKELGGHTKVVHDCIDRVLQRFAENPRALPLLENAARSLRAQAPEIRTRVQAILARLPLARRSFSPNKGSVPRQRGPLPHGAFPEIEVRAARIGWKGKVDLLVVSDDSCEIIDFKTGAPDEAHHFQVQVYALLWSLDEELNPTTRLADRLVLAYSDRDVVVPAPNAEQLVELERQVVGRRDQAHRAILKCLPEARPGAESCRYCGVRQLCAEYWARDTQRAIAADRDDRRFCDVEVEVTGRHGPSSWDAVIVVSGGVEAGKPALLRTTGSTVFQTGAHLRILDAAVALDPDDGDQPVVFTVGMFSESFVVA